MMRRRPLRALLPLAIVALVALAGACGGDDDEATGPVETDLSGDYVMISVTQGGVTLGPDQGATGIPCDITVEGDSVEIRVPAIQGTYTGTLGADGNTLTGLDWDGANIWSVTKTTPGKPDSVSSVNATPAAAGRKYLPTRVPTTSWIRIAISS